MFCVESCKLNVSVVPPSKDKMLYKRAVNNRPYGFVTTFRYSVGEDIILPSSKDKMLYKRDVEGERARRDLVPYSL